MYLFNRLLYGEDDELITLDSQELVQLNKLIEENLRVGRGQPPIYVDISNNKDRILAKQNHIVFGRRGSGKSTLLLTAKKEAEADGFLCIYFDSELIKENPFPDILISVLTRIFEYLLEDNKVQSNHGLSGLLIKIKFKKDALQEELKNEINTLLKLKGDPEKYTTARKITITHEKRTGGAVKASKSGVEASVEASRGNTSTVQEDAEITKIKIESLQQNLESYQSLILRSLNRLNKDMMFFLDDFTSFLKIISLMSLIISIEYPKGQECI